LRYAEQLDSGEFTGPLWGDIPIVADRSCMDLTAEQFAALAATALRRPPPAPPPSVVPGNALFESVFGSVNNPVFNQLFFTPDVKDEDIPSMQAERLCVQRHDTVMIHGDLLEIYRDGQLIGTQPAWTVTSIPVTVALKEKWSSKIET
jgi:streptomycin 6-kinase